ncbi:uncharacterized protein LOC144159852 [Haemaphysalis longicornis]
MVPHRNSLLQEVVLTLSQKLVLAPTPAPHIPATQDGPRQSPNDTFCSVKSPGHSAGQAARTRRDKKMPTESMPLATTLVPDNFVMTMSTDASHNRSVHCRGTQVAITTRATGTYDISCFTLFCPVFLPIF